MHGKKRTKYSERANLTAQEALGEIVVQWNRVVEAEKMKRKKEKAKKEMEEEQAAKDAELLRNDDPEADKSGQGWNQGYKKWWDTLDTDELYRLRLTTVDQFFPDVKRVMKSICIENPPPKWEYLVPERPRGVKLGQRPNPFRNVKPSWTHAKQWRQLNALL